MVLPKANDLTYEQVANKYSYDPLTGELKRVAKTTQLGRKVGYVCPRGYKHIWILGKSRLYHRIAWLMHYGTWPEEEIDHIDGDAGNNKISNLRLVSRIENARNRKVSSNNKTGITGVWWSNTEKRWIATIWINKKQIQLGQFKDMQDAINARKSAEKEKYGEYTRQIPTAAPSGGSSISVADGTATGTIPPPQAELLSQIVGGPTQGGGGAEGNGEPPQAGGNIG